MPMIWSRVVLYVLSLDIKKVSEYGLR